METEISMAQSAVICFYYAEIRMEKTLLTYADIISDPTIPCKTVNTIKAWIKRGLFPQPVPFGPRLKRFTADSIEKWKAERLAPAA